MDEEDLKQLPTKGSKKGNGYSQSRVAPRRLGIGKEVREKIRKS